MRSALAREGMLKRPSWAERRTVPTDRLPEQQLHEQVSPKEELIDVLSWGEQVGLIGSGDRLLLSSLVEQTDRLGVRTVCRSGQGLMSASALARRRRNSDRRPGQCADARGGASTRWRQRAGRVDLRRRSERRDCFICPTSGRVRTPPCLPRVDLDDLDRQGRTRCTGGQTTLPGLPDDQPILGLRRGCQG